jgi:tetratricopeptide (TPR) repeat protein
MSDRLPAPATTAPATSVGTAAAAPATSAPVAASVSVTESAGPAPASDVAPAAAPSPPAPPSSRTLFPLLVSGGAVLAGVVLVTVGLVGAATGGPAPSRSAVAPVTASGPAPVGALRADGPAPATAPRADGPAPGRAAGTADSATRAGSGPSLTDAISAAQTRLRSTPSDQLTWARLGAAYVQQARATSDPSYYPKAEGALRRSLQLQPDGNLDALTGMGALANARHEFAAALSWGRRAIALDAYRAEAYGVTADALTQLGRYDEADAAIQRMLDLQPGLASFSRASYAFEQRGRTAPARDSMRRALAEASEPADVAFCRYYLGELELNAGRPEAALEQYRLGLGADPGSGPLLAGRAKAEAALGHPDQAVRDYAEVVQRLPLPEYVLDYARLLDSLGRTGESRSQYALLTSMQQLFAANGVVDDLTSAVVEADHGSPAEAVRHARAEWQRRHSVLVADALAWALHRAGRDREALPYTARASALGWRNATFDYHRGMIELALGQREPARRHLSAALRTDPHFDPVQAPKAVAALTSLGGTA